MAHATPLAGLISLATRGLQCGESRGLLMIQQRLQMHFDAIRKAIDVVAAFQNAHQSSAAVRVRHLQHEFREL